MSCKDHREFEPAESKTYNTKKGLKYAKLGTCPDCGTKIVVMVKKDA